MTRQRPTKRMQRRIGALNATLETIHPGFCQGMTCDATCPCYNSLAANDSKCAWMRILTDIKRMNVKLKYMDGIEIDEQ